MPARTFASVSDYLHYYQDTGVIKLDGEVNEEMERAFKLCIAEFERERRGDYLILTFDTNGGERVVSRTIRTILSSIEVDTYGVVLGNALSSGMFMLQACKYRLAYPEAYLMVHWGTGMLKNKDFYDMFSGNQGGFYSRVREELEEMFETVASRVNQPRDELLSYFNSEAMVPASKALEFGWIDRVIPVSTGYRDYIEEMRTRG